MPNIGWFHSLLLLLVLHDVIFIVNWTVGGTKNILRHHIGLLENPMSIFHGFIVL